jgi:uncharacterized protein (DUF2235 family)
MAGGEASNGARNIVLCCDGTSNQYGGSNTNVVRLYQMLVKDPARQLAFYDPGVGTFGSQAALTPVAKFITKVMGLAFGLGLTSNIEAGYTYLMNNWNRGDRVYIFGFSRGAYTARGIAAMLHKCGLFEHGHERLVPYAAKMFRKERDPAIWNGFKTTFGRECPVRFLGLWDTVSSVGWVWDPVRLPFSANNPEVTIVRHAVAIDERRAFFRQNLWGDPPNGQDVKQVWFAGDHCDVGGSYPETQSGLSQIALEWMVREARAAGLLIDPALLQQIVPPRDRAPGNGAQPPDWRQEIHTSLKWYWWPAEFFPKVVQRREGGDQYVTGVRLNLGRRRFMPDGAVVHQSVKDKMDGSDYRPGNLPATPGVEAWS